MPMERAVADDGPGGGGVPPVPRSTDFVIVTGMSGAGRSTAANVIEDRGWYVVDNLPPQLLSAMAELAGRCATPGSSDLRIAAVVDVRARAFHSELQAGLAALRDAGWHPHLIFLDATDEALVRRFESVRRPHPLQGDGRLLDGIQAEREMLRDLRAEAQVVIDTSGLNVHQLGRKLDPAARWRGRAERAAGPDVVRLQVRRAARRRLRLRHALPAQPVLGARAQGAHRRRRPGGRLGDGPGGRHRVPRPGRRR